jgi:hypothetical protein
MNKTRLEALTTVQDGILVSNKSAARLLSTP